MVPEQPEIAGLRDGQGRGLGDLVFPRIRFPGPQERIKFRSIEAEAQEIVVWNPSTGRQVNAVAGSSGAVNAVAVDPSGALIAAAHTDGTVRIVDGATGESRLVLDGHIGAVTWVSFDGDGSRLASTGLDGIVRVWSLDRAELVALAEDRVTRWLTASECSQYVRDRRCRQT